MKQLFLCCVVMSSVCAMELNVKSLNYEGLKTSLDEFELLNLRALAKASSREIQRKAYKLIMSLVEEQRITENDSLLLSECLKGRSGELRVEPSTLVVRDFCVYCSVLCSHDILARELYRSSHYTEDRLEKFTPKLFFVAIHNDCFLLAERILRGAAQCYGKKELTTAFFIQLAPVFFYKKDKEVLIRMGNVLGSCYMSSSDLLALLAGFNNDLEALSRKRSQCDMDYSSVLTAILIGFCIQPESSGLEVVKYVWNVLSGSVMRSSLGKKESFRRMLILKAQEAENHEIAEFLNINSR